MAPGFISEIVFSFIIWRDCSVKGQWRDIISLWESSSPTGRYLKPEEKSGNGSYAVTFIPNPEATEANSLPIFPVPITPAVFPFSPIPVSPFRLKLNSLVLRYALCVFLQRVNNSAKACSATAEGEYAGTRTNRKSSPCRGKDLRYWIRRISVPQNVCRENKASLSRQHQACRSQI